MSGLHFGHFLLDQSHLKAVVSALNDYPIVEMPPVERYTFLIQFCICLCYSHKYKWPIFIFTFWALELKVLMGLAQ